LQKSKKWNFGRSSTTLNLKGSDSTTFSKKQKADTLALAALLGIPTPDISAKARKAIMKSRNLSDYTRNVRSAMG
jgi:hypothetical protein